MSIIDLISDVAVQDAFRITRAAAQTAIFGGSMIKRIVSTAWNGVCQICNNLQPLNHEKTFGASELPWEKRPWANKEDLIETPTLVIEGILPKDIRASVEIDFETSKLKRDCPYCRLLCEVFDAFFELEWLEPQRSGPYAIGGLRSSVTLMIKQGQPLIIKCVGFGSDPSVSTPIINLEMYTASVLPRDVTDAPTTSMTGRRSTDSSDQGCMQFIKDCMHQCWHHHPRCCGPQLSASNFTPTRLIYTGQDCNDVRLLKAASTGLRLHWAALSHCWGGGDPFALKIENFDSLMTNIPIDRLPATFTNAIRICRELGIEYLWIDSLCIIQNDTQDWEKEAAQMGLVYSHALVVISGASSKSPDVPFLGPREEEWLPKEFEFHTPKTGRTIPILVRRRHLNAAPLEQGLHEPPYTEFWSHPRRQGPLYKRAWCFQESHLAVRNLQFSLGGIIFECQTHRRSEDQLPPYPQLYSNILGQVDVGLKWRMIVQQYTSWQLTFASDKLPAIAGVASLMPQASRTSYLAGLWQESLLMDLLWHANPLPRAVLSYPRDQLTAPSWSWASLNRVVVYNDLESFTPLAQVVHAESTPKTTTLPFGAVAHASITLRAHKRPCKIRWSPKKCSYVAYYPEFLGMFQEKRFMSDGLLAPQYLKASLGSRYACRATDQPPCDGEMDAHFVCLGSTRMANFGSVGLLVTPSVTVEGAWERVGSLVNVRRKWWEGVEEVEVTLV